MCFEVLELERVGLCCGLDWGCVVGHKSRVVPFYNQHVRLSFYHHCHRKVIFVICPRVFGSCSMSENESDVSVVMVILVLDGEAWTFGVGWDCVMRWKESVSSGVFWLNVSEKHLKV